MRKAIAYLKLQNILKLEAILPSKEKTYRGSQHIIYLKTDYTLVKLLMEVFHLLMKVYKLLIVKLL